MKFVVDGHEYPMIEDPTLGELRVLKREFDLRGVDKLDPMDPDHIAGLLYLSMHRANPSVTVADVDNVREVEVVDDDGDPPTEAADAPAG